MMPAPRPPEERVLSPEARADLQRRHDEAAHFTPRSPRIDAAWAKLSGTATRAELVAALREIFNDKCAYCEIILPRDIEHFYPQKRFPERMFRWDNLLFVCKNCNTDKNARFPMEGAKPLLIDPSAEDPALFITWAPLTWRPLPTKDAARRGRAEVTLKVLPQISHQTLADVRRQLSADVLFLLTEVLEESPRPADVLARLREKLSPTQPWRSVLRQLVSEEPALIAAVRARAPELAPLLDALPPMPLRPPTPLPPTP